MFDKFFAWISVLCRAATFKVRVKPDNCVWMEQTILKNLIICMPEVLNYTYLTHRFR